MQAYCVKCKVSSEMVNPIEVVFKNGRKADRALCPRCGTAIHRIKSSAI